MYYEGRWEREFFEKRINKFQEPSIWQLSFLLVYPTLIAIVSLALWMFIGKYIDVGIYLTYLGG
jgi:hypothetical protein